MTVQELIEELEKMPPDLKVRHASSLAYGGDAEVGKVSDYYTCVVID